ncbi:hypothetical protein FGG08_006060 [Glutinoglossum americanum]|uniref:SNF2 N-terminal domain-containing protein n=1 Tax=Glutinoglossum americanum TaxID=1670608 RepID=A0A9P8L2C1_9PEZI|nr:hypothetical protein FGG08_006060 [Glutinoglossum americanum]
MRNPRKRGRDISVDNVPAKRVLAGDNEDSGTELAADDIDVLMADAIAPTRAEGICYGAMGNTTPADFAVLDLVTTAHLHSLRQFSDLSFIAIVSSSWLSSVPRKATHKKTIINLTVNVMGPEAYADDVGEAVAAASGYFQHPVFLEAGISYINPHYFYPGNQKSDLRHLIGPAKTDSRVMRIFDGIENVLESLDNPSSLPVSLEGKDVSLAINQCLIDTQLKRRFQSQTLSVYDFHGESRAKTCEALADYDVVLTTYHTLAADWKGHRVLQDTRWFRVVLDEGE